MGTKAVFALTLDEGNRYYSTIIGMTSDGFPNNLKYLTDLCRYFKKKLNLDKIDSSNYLALFNSVIEHVRKEQPNWLFLDDCKNASCVSYSMMYNPNTDKSYLYEDLFGYLVEGT